MPWALQGTANMAVRERTKRQSLTLLLLATLSPAALALVRYQDDLGAFWADYFSLSLPLLMAAACVGVALRDSREGRIISWAFCIGLGTIAILAAAFIGKIAATNPKCGYETMLVMGFGTASIVGLTTIYIGTRLARRIGLRLQLYRTV
jgi:hypothetical protein